jgi:hypothetical protein
VNTVSSTSSLLHSRSAAVSRSVLICNRHLATPAPSCTLFKPPRFQHGACIASKERCTLIHGRSEADFSSSRKEKAVRMSPGVLLSKSRMVRVLLVFCSALWHVIFGRFGSTSSSLGANAGPVVTEVVQELPFITSPFHWSKIRPLFFGVIESFFREQDILCPPHIVLATRVLFRVYADACHQGHFSFDAFYLCRVPHVPTNGLDTAHTHSPIHTYSYTFIARYPGYSQKGHRSEGFKNPRGAT